MSVTTQARNFETLIGYGQPNNNDNDEACALGLARLQLLPVESSPRVASTSEGSGANGNGGRSSRRGAFVAALLCVAAFVGVILLAAKSRWVRRFLAGLGDRTYLDFDESSRASDPE